MGVLHGPYEQLIPMTLILMPFSLDEITFGSTSPTQLQINYFKKKIHQLGYHSAIA